MLFVRPLSEEEIQTLIDAHRYHPSSWTRTRAHCILLSNQRYALKEIAAICNISRQTVSSAIHEWDSIGFLGLVDEHRIGRQKILTKTQEHHLIDKVVESPRSIKKVLSEFSEAFQISLSLSTLKRICKAAGLSWKRVRKSLKSIRSEADYEQSKSLINNILMSYKANEINVFYFDEAGFSLTPCIPYAWQKKSEQIEIPASKSQTLNVAGFVSRGCEFESFVFTGSITSDVVIACFDVFAEKTAALDKPTIVLVDNAPVHASEKFDRMTVEWCKKGLIVVPISKYSPELNSIEIVWRKIKYEWMPFSAYQSFDKLKESLYDILSKIGSEYKVNFC